MPQTASLRSTPRDAVPIAVFRDPTHDVTVVDVSEWRGTVDRSVLGRMGDLVLVCFGDHPAPCPLTDDPTETHGVVFEISGDGDAETGFIDVFRTLVDPGIPIRVISRASPAHMETA